MRKNSSQNTQSLVAFKVSVVEREEKFYIFQLKSTDWQRRKLIRFQSMFVRVCINGGILQQSYLNIIFLRLIFNSFFTSRGESKNKLTKNYKSNILFRTKGQTIEWKLNRNSVRKKKGKP